MTVTAVQDTVYEGNETVVVDITGVTNGTESGTQQATTTITDDDTAADGDAWPWHQASIAENGGRGDVHGHAVQRQHAGGDGGPGLHGHGHADGRLHADGHADRDRRRLLTGSVTVTAVQDTIVEGNETVVVDITGVTNGTESGTQQATTTITDDDKLTVQFDTASSSDDESVGGELPVLLVTGEVQTGYSVVVSVTRTGGTAGSGDYANTATVTIGAGVYDGTSATAVPTNLTIINDSTAEPDETIQLTLSTASSQVTLGTQTTTEYTILDDDGMTVLITASDASAAEQNSENGQFKVTLYDVNGNAKKAPWKIEVQYTINGTATNGVDYNVNTALTGTVVIAKNDKWATITVNPFDDAIVEHGGEDVKLVLEKTNRATVKLADPKTATVTIADNDATTVSIAANDASASETGPNAGQFTVTLDNNKVAPDGGIDVVLSIGGSATSVKDYQPLSTSVKIAAGQKSATIDVVRGRLIVEPGGETVVLTITETNNGSVTPPIRPRTRPQ